MISYNFVCEECAMVCKNKRALSAHMRSHKNEWIGLKCKICGKICKNQFGLDRHTQNKHDERYRKKISEASISRFKDEEFVTKFKKHEKEVMNRPDVRKRLIDNTTKAVRRAYATNKDYRKHVSEASLRQWNCSAEKKAERISRSLRGRAKTMHCLSKDGNLLYLDSSYEKVFADLLFKDSNVLSYDRCHKTIQYIYENKKKNYLPDFVILTKTGLRIILEVKSKYTVKDKLVPDKIRYASKYAKEHDSVYIIVTEIGISMYQSILEKEIMQ
jgi:hypothetical protein